MSDQPIRDAATVILVRDAETRPRILMGQRGAGAVFMPNKMVFPGGAVDAGDAAVALAAPIRDPNATRLRERSDRAPEAIVAAAIRELWEETGLILGRPGDWSGAPEDWAEFAATGHLPDPEPLTFVFRAVTPPGRPRRFDARFFIADAGRLMSDPDDFSRASDELGNLGWFPLDEIRQLSLPFITEVVLAEVSARLPDLGPPETVPFFLSEEEETLFRRLGGRAL